MNKINIFFCVLIFNVNINLFAFSRNQLSNLKENFEAIFFGGGYLNEKLEINKKIKALYQIDLNKWNGESRLQIVIRELETR